MAPSVPGPLLFLLSRVLIPASLLLGLYLYFRSRGGDQESSGGLGGGAPPGLCAPLASAPWRGCERGRLELLCAFSEFFTVHAHCRMAYLGRVAQPLFRVWGT
jgi:hypothetical protein